MKNSNAGFGVKFRSLVVVMVVMTLGFSLTPTYRAEAHWSGTSFLGGMAAGHMVGRIGRDMRARTRAACGAEPMTCCKPNSGKPTASWSWPCSPARCRTKPRACFA